MIPNVGPMEVLIVLVVALVVFGPKRLPELGNSLGKGIRGFGSAIKGEEAEHPAEREAAQIEAPAAEAAERITSSTAASS